MNISDATGDRRVTAFNEVAGDILGMSVQTLGELKENGNDIYKEKINEVVLKKCMFFLKVKAEVFNVTNFIVRLIISMRLSILLVSCMVTFRFFSLLITC